MKEQPCACESTQNGEAECHLPNLCTMLKQEMISDMCLVCSQDTAAMIFGEPVCISFIKKKKKKKGEKKPADVTAVNFWSHESSTEVVTVKAPHELNAR